MDVDPSATAGKYPGAVTNLTLVIGGVEVSGVPGATLAGEDTSAIYVNLNEGYADYSAAAGAPTGGAWVQVALWDDDGTPFASDALPLEIPTPYDAYFPDDRSFFLRLPGSAEIILSGIVGESPAVVRAGTHTRVRADLDLRADDAGDRHLDLLWGVAGEQAVSFGEFSCPGCEVMGVEPSPFRWRALNLDGEQPAVGEAVLTINLEHPGGEVMGVEPSPFRVFLDLGDGGTGALDFSEATATFPGPLGSLVLEGVRVVLENGTVVDLDGFDIYDATDKVALSGTRFDRFIALAVGDEPDVVGLLASSDDSDLGIAANGWLLYPGCEVMGVEPSPFKWLAVDEDSTPAADGREVAGFSRPARRGRGGRTVAFQDVPEPRRRDPRRARLRRGRRSLPRCARRALARRREIVASRRVVARLRGVRELRS